MTRGAANGGAGSPAPPAPPPQRILLASEGRAIPASAVARAAALAKPANASAKAPVHVFSVARVWGTSLGLPNPGLLPTKREWDQQRQQVADAVKALKRHGIQATGHVLGTRRATKRIVSEAERLHSDLLWSQEPYRVKRKATVPVHLVIVSDATPAPARARPSRHQRNPR